ncbi:MAG: ATP-binding cassette subfamily F protein 3, partial [Glaciecola sp.]
MLTVSNVAKGFAARDLFHDVGFRLLAGKRLAIVGGNGTGKTTLLEIAAGVQDADEGTVSLERDAVLGYLPQEVMVDPDAIVFEEVLAGAGNIVDLERRMAVLEERVTADPTEANVQALVDTQDQYRNAGGYEIEATAHRTLAGLGFATADTHRRVGELSGGWAMRVALARMLMSGADVLLLDEPTNHLDITSITWLEETIRERNGALLLVSHDRDFIDAVATDVLEIRGGRAEEYQGGFQDFIIEREERIQAQLSAVKNQNRQREHLEAYVDRFRYTASKARQAQSKIKQLEKLEKIEVNNAK